MKTVVIFGGAGFIGHHLAKRFYENGDFVICVDIKSKKESSEFVSVKKYCSKYISCDLRIFKNVENVIRKYKPDELYQLAADMGGAGYIFTGENDANLMTNSSLININTLVCIQKYSINTKIFYSSSACMYPSYNQEDPENPNCREDSAYPANPDSEYGWEKLFSERLYLSYKKNYNLNIRIARFHNIFGPEGTWNGGREKAPAALCRKIAKCEKNGTIDVWGDGTQTRSFLYIDECVDGVINLMNSNYSEPVNIGSEEMVSINKLCEIISEISNKNIKINHISGPIGVRGRNSDNNLIYEKIGWKPNMKLKDGLRETYFWILKQLENIKTE